VNDAQREVADGSNAEAQQMASTIVTDQTAKIDHMQKLLAKLRRCGRRGGQWW
jgi:uncharacterized protein (DUF305 family)